MPNYARHVLIVGKVCMVSLSHTIPSHTYLNMTIHTYAHTIMRIVAVKQCSSLISIPHGHVVYQTIDTPAILPGDFASYSCDAPYRLLGSPERFCLRNGSWSGLEPLCIGRQKLKYVIYMLDHSCIPKTETAKNVVISCNTITAQVTHQSACTWANIEIDYWSYTPYSTVKTRIATFTVDMALLNDNFVTANYGQITTNTKS